MGKPPPYVELHCHSAYSFRDGASDPAELAGAAAELGYEALALTDHDGVSGAMEFAHACAGVGVRSIVGAELTVKSMDGDSGSHITLLAETAAGWSNLCRLITLAHAGTRGGEGTTGGGTAMREALPPSLPLAELEAHAGGLVCLSGCAREGAVAGRWERGDPTGGAAMARLLLSAFGPDHFRIELQRPLWRHDRARNRWLASLAGALGVPCVATGNVHAHVRSRLALQDALVAIRLGATLDESEGMRRGNSAAALMSPARAAARFRDHPDAVAESARLAERLRFDLTKDLGYSYPGAEDPTAGRRLAGLCRSMLDERYAGSSYRARAEARLDEELGLIDSLKLAGFFLLHHEMLELAREVALEVRGPESARRLLPPGRGRGSSVSSIVCFLTGLSHIDPIENDLFLGRFLNEELDSMPDIDLDFPRDIRERLIPLVHERHGADRSALVAAISTYRARGAVRDLGKALGLPPGEVERLARSVDVYEASADAPARMEEALGRLRARSPRWKALAELLPEIAGLPRHISQHPGGMIISTKPLVELCPVQPAAMEGRQIVQWDKDSCADAGFLKIDLLGLGMLSAVERCVDEIARTRSERIDLSRVPLDDGEVWSAIQRAETTGVFQIESRAQMQMLPRTLPADLDDLTVQVALVRPGPIQGGAVHPYIERRKALRADPSYKVPYEHPSLEPVLKDTLGAIVFQDQVLEVAIALAGFSVGEAEGLRRAMSRRRSEAAMRRYQQRFVSGAVDRGVDQAVAERVYDQIVGFSGFGFPKSHSAAFGLLAYQSTWLRVHYGPEFLCALLNEQPMGFYPPDALVHEAQRRGLDVLPPDVNTSELDCRVETAGAAPGSEGSPPVRIGLGYVNDVGESDAGAVIAERARGGAYANVADLAARSGASRGALVRFAWAGALDRIAGSTADLLEDERRSALWQAGGASRAARAAVKGMQGDQLALPLDGAPAPDLPELEPWERMVADYRSTGITIGTHPMEMLRAELDPAVLTSEAIGRTRHGAPVRVAGMVVARQRPATAKGIVFMLLEDEHGVINLIVPPPVVERHRLAVRTSGFVVASGKLEHREGTTNVLVGKIERLEHTGVEAAGTRAAGGAGIPPELETPVDRPPVRERTPRPAREQAVSELAAALPAPHSFGRRGR